MNSFSSNGKSRLAPLLAMGLAIAGSAQMPGGAMAENLNVWNKPKTGGPSYPTKVSGSHKQNARKSRKKRK